MASNGKNCSSTLCHSVLLFVANLMLVVLRDIKEDFLVKIIDMNGQSSWMFAQVDTVVTLIILALFGAMVFVKSNIKVWLPCWDWSYLGQPP